MPVIGRRAALAIHLATLLPWPARAEAGAAFRVVREGRDIGTHRVTLTTEAGAQVARSDVEIAVRLAGIVVYRYTHHTVETWRDGRLVGMDAELDRNGTPLRAYARAGAGGLTVTGTAGAGRLPAEAAPLTWWRQASLGVPLFDPRDGKVLTPAIARTATPDGGAHYTLSGTESAEVQYDRAGNWTGFSTRGDDGSTVTYQRS